MKNTWILLLACSMFLPVTALSEVLLIDAVGEAQRANVPRPKNGTPMSAVEKRFGTPLSKQGPVGDPPITRWDYKKFVVYFEFDRVITSVLKRQ
ncbi:MAG TPA: hypothetical protein ENG92_05420 [Thiolapillus brandeum]|uniref:Phosphodiesterase n=1 Tax=Thiolapillus brandeum TaxID=1076588 RepID=A0A831NTV1_9GAMM|nr:hypothetical protein [Thiolapillus brandeum]